MRREALRTACLRPAERGSTLVEFALVIILLLTMLLGITEFSRALYAYHFVSNAAREASRYAAVRGSTCNEDGSCVDDGHCANTATSGCVGSYVKSIAPNGIDTSGTGCGGSGCISTDVEWSAQPNSPNQCSGTNGVAKDLKYPGCTVQVAVSYNFQFLFPFISKNGITLASTSSMVIAH